VACLFAASPGDGVGPCPFPAHVFGQIMRKRAASAVRQDQPMTQTELAALPTSPPQTGPRRIEALATPRAYLGPAGAPRTAGICPRKTCSTQLRHWRFRGLLCRRARGNISQLNTTDPAA